MDVHINSPGNEYASGPGEPIEVDDISEEDSDSVDDSDGGMQLDYNLAPVATEEINRLSPDFMFPGSQSDHDIFSSRAPAPNAYQRHHSSQPQSQVEGLIHPALQNQGTEDLQCFENLMSQRTPMTEEEHAALTVLNDDELLMMYALKSGHTIPQTRRRFQAKLVAGGDIELEEDLYAARFVIPESQVDYVPNLINQSSTEVALGLNNTEAFCVTAKWTKSLGSMDDSEWIAPGSKIRLARATKEPEPSSSSVPNFTYENGNVRLSERNYASVRLGR